MTYFLSLGNSPFTQKDEVFKTISTATASRDLKKAVEDDILKSEGQGNRMRYF
jgi:Fic family protein